MKSNSNIVCLLEFKNLKCYPSNKIDSHGHLDDTIVNISGSSISKKLNGAKRNIDRSQMMIKDLNHKDTDYKVLNNHLKMSLVLLERARSALHDALVDINLNRLKSQESTCHN